MQWQLSCKRVISLIALIGLSASLASAGSIIYVKADAGGANSGASWANAYTSLQSALGAAAAGDEIWIAAGTYKPTLDNNQGTSFVLVPHVALYGGFAGTETSRDQRDWKARQTILSGDIGTTGPEDNCIHVVAGANSATLDGLWITGGRGGGEDGIGIYNAATSLTVTRCNIHDNWYADYGGGIYNDRGASITVSNCTFHRNGAVYGAAIFSRLATVDLNNCTFDDNYGTYAITSHGAALDVTSCTFIANDGAAYNYKGASVFQRCKFLSHTVNYAMVNYLTTSTLRSCVFAQNTSGGMRNQQSQLTLLNCVFSKNQTGHGGAMYNLDLVSLVLKHCTLVENSATWMGGAIYNKNSSPRIYNSILCANYAPPMAGGNIYNESGVPTLYYCDVYNFGGGESLGGVDGGGNILVDPWLVDGAKPAGPDGIWMTADDGYGLRANSPCRNAANPAYAPAVDILNNSRLGKPDIGAYECLINAAGHWRGYP